MFGLIDLYMQPGIFLNPKFFYYGPDEMSQDEEVMNGLYGSITKLTKSDDIEDEILKELVTYKNADGIFAKSTAKRQRNLISPAEWWGLYGASTPNLQKSAIRILSLTCSSSGCERNWSVFENKRNRLQQQRLNNLIFIKYNRALRCRFDKRDTIDPIILDNGVDNENEWMVGRMENGEDILVFDNDDLNWGDVETAMGVNEEPYQLRGS
ncbi:uncharacterized protein LOC130994107 [Salvia miltiorrhiza]|uniref:uncharacterized protein LOC130994107 n=1 Tax=Salvia miltiorrhiza TaxID=226208 RepID=UPI0025AC7AC5|nr:uncharacterized protein LOC130994107 [Salvia miltiorrhiza]